MSKITVRLENLDFSLWAVKRERSHLSAVPGKAARLQRSGHWLCVQAERTWTLTVIFQPSRAWHFWGLLGPRSRSSRLNVADGPPPGLQTASPVLTWWVSERALWARIPFTRAEPRHPLTTVSSDHVSASSPAKASVGPTGQYSPFLLHIAFVPFCP